MNMMNFPFDPGSQKSSGATDRPQLEPGVPNLGLSEDWLFRLKSTLGISFKIFKYDFVY